MLASHLLDFIEITFTGVLVVTLVHAASMFQHMLSVWMVQQFQGCTEPEKTPARATKKGTRRAKNPAVKTGVTGLLELVAERERAALRDMRSAVTNAGGR